MNRKIVALLVVTLSASFAMATDWPGLQTDSAHNGVVSAPGPIAGLSTLWSTNIYSGTGSLGMKFMVGAQPVLFNGTLYAYALGDSINWGPSPARLVALNATNGSVQWSIPLADEGGWGSHNGAAVDPATGDIYVASWYTLYRVSATTHSVVWQHELSGSFGANAVVNSAPTIANGKAYWITQGGDGHLVGVDQNAPGGTPTVAVYKDMTNGIGGSSFGSPASFTIAGKQYLAVGYTHGYGFPMGGGIMVVDADNGTELWRHDQTELAAGATDAQKAGYAFAGTMTYKDGVLYARSYDDMHATQTFNGTLYAFNAATGAMIWKTTDLDTNATDAIYDNVPNGHGAPVVAGGKVFVGGGSSAWGNVGTKVQAYDATTGSRIWSRDDMGGWQNQVVYAGGYLYVGNEDGNKLFVLNPADGSTVAQYSGGGSSPTIADGVVYMVGANGEMLAVTPEPATLTLLGIFGVAAMIRRRRK